MVKDERFALFETAIGWCGVVWSPRGLTAIRLPGENAASTRRAIATASPSATEATPPSTVAEAVRQMTALLAGQPAGLEHIQLDMTRVPVFHRRVYEVARRIGPGSVWTYGDVARAVGSAGAARAVGRALGRNPFPIVVPCHRVVAAGGRLGGFSAPGGVTVKQRLLEIEGAARQATTPRPAVVDPHE